MKKTIGSVRCPSGKNVEENIKKSANKKRGRRIRREATGWEQITSGWEGSSQVGLACKGDGKKGTEVVEAQDGGVSGRQHRGRVREKSSRASQGESIEG
eukprot:4051060-Pleurochrysis_carterae.AAC.2